LGHQPSVNIPRQLAVPDLIQGDLEEHPAHTAVRRCRRLVEGEQRSERLVHAAFDGVVRRDLQQ
jgi:hypothetical protein